MVQTWLLAMLMVIGQVLPSKDHQCDGCLMGPVAPASEVAVPVVADTDSVCAHLCCHAPEADRVGAPVTPDADSENGPCGHQNCDGGCKCPGSCCASVQLVAVAKVMTFDLGLPIEAEPMAIPEARLSARDAQLSLLRPPRA